MTGDKQPSGYNCLAKGFHWLSALIVLGLVPLGFYMSSIEFSPLMTDLYAWHKSFGTLLLFIVAFRILWRFSKGVPAPLESHAVWEVWLAKFVHVLLYLGLIGMPVSGWLMTSYGQFPHAFFGFNIPPITPKDQDMYRLMRELHGIFAYCLIAAICLHVAGAFKHHLMDRDSTLTRILPKSMPRSGAVIAILVFVTSMGLSAVFYMKHVENHGHNDHSVIIEKIHDTEEHDEADHESGHSHVHEKETVANQDAVTDEADSRVQSWVINKDESIIGFTASTYGAAFDGTFGSYDGEIVFDPENLTESYVKIAVDVGSVSTGGESRDGYMMDKAWLYEDKFPQAVFESKIFTKTGVNQYEAAGTLTMRGISLPAVFPFTLHIKEGADGRAAHADGEFMINRLDYEIGGGDWSDPEMASHEIKIAVTITATTE